MTDMSADSGSSNARQLLPTARVPALGAAISLGLARFSYALLLPPMRADLGWSYVTAGAMNTVNAAGYLLGALLAPGLMRRYGARWTFLVGAWLAAVFLAGHGLLRHDFGLYLLRLLTGIASALSFVAGGWLAAHLAQRTRPESGLSGGLILGLYYGGVGLGIIGSTVLVPLLVSPLARGLATANWPHAWWALAALSALFAWIITRHAALPSLDRIHAESQADASRPQASLRSLSFGLMGYTFFGLGYIGYMTFIVTLLGEQAHGTRSIMLFYGLLGLGVVGSPFLWAGLLQRHRDGIPLMLLNALLALATVLPVLSDALPVALLSGALFGAVFLSLVASTTALVRHNLPQADWARGIGAFTIVFACGQIVGPTLVGYLADARGGLASGLSVSAALLALGALLAARQRALGPCSPDHSLKP